MEIKFQKIKLHNFFSFTDAELDLADMGFTMVEGRNHCKLDNAYSNGSGKSSIFNGICYALTGETAQGISNGIENIFANPDDCWVELYFNAEGNDFIVRRTKTPWAKLNIMVNGVDKSGKGVRESTKILADYLPDLTSTLVNSVIILGQGLPNRFTNNKPAQRKEILEKLTKSDFMIESIKNKLEQRKSELNIKLREKEDSILANKSQLNVYNDQLTSYKKNLKQFEEYGGSENSIQAFLDSLNEKLTENIKNAEVIKEKIDKKTKEFEAITESKEQYLLNSQAELDAKLNPIDKDLKEKTNTITNLKSEIKVLKNEIRKLESITDICPTCGQKIPGATKIDTSEHKDKLKVLEETLMTSIKGSEVLEDTKNSIVKDFNKIKNETLDKFTTDSSKLRIDLSKLNSDNVYNNDEKLSLTAKISELTNLKTNYIKLLSDISSAEAVVEKLTSDNNRLESDVADIKAHLDIVQQMVTLAKREFRGVLLLNIIEYINKKVKQYSKKVFDTEELTFYLDENEIDISYCGKPYENLSGGERQKIDVIVQLALRDILSNQLNIHSNIIILDEIFDNLDSQGCSKIMDLISGLNDIDSVFIISHHAQDLELTKDTSILVEKDEAGISKLKIV